MRPKTRVPNPSPDSSSPSTSRPGAVTVVRVSGTHRYAPTTTSTPIGRLTRKIHGQVNDVVSQPPASGPTAAAPEITAPHTPNAAARSLPRNVAFTVDSVDGRIAAAPRPCTRRPPTSVPPSSAAADSREPTRNSATPATSRRRRPSRSPSLPADSSSPASTTAYDALTHWASLSPRSRSATMSGIATATIVPSMTTIDSATDSTTRACHRWSCEGPPASGCSPGPPAGGSIVWSAFMPAPCRRRRPSWLRSADMTPCQLPRGTRRPADAVAGAPWRAGIHGPRP